MAGSGGVDRVPLVAAQFRDNFDHRDDLRLIGIELRLQTPLGNVEELEMLPIEWCIPGSMRSMGVKMTMPCTLHTSEGDVGFQFWLP